MFKNSARGKGARKEKRFGLNGTPAAIFALTARGIAKEQFHEMDAFIDGACIHWRGQCRLRHHMRVGPMVLPA
jgi:hypothetical protein